MASYAFSGSPPLQPESNLSQSTNSCSENESNLPWWILYWPSTLPVTLKAQHDPHCPWSFTFVTKTAPASYLIKKAISLESGSPEPHKEKVGSITRDQLKNIAEAKMEDLNANDIDAAINIIAGTARSMGVTVEN